MPILQAINGLSTIEKYEGKELPLVGSIQAGTSLSLDMKPEDMDKMIANGWTVVDGRWVYKKETE